MRSRDEPSPALLDLAQNTEQSALPFELPDDFIHVIETKALELPQPVQHTDPESGEISKRNIRGSHSGVRLRAYGLEQVSLASAMGAAQPGRPRDARVRRATQMLDRLPIARGQKAREYRAIGKSNTERKLLHDRENQEGCAGGDQIRRVNVAM